MHSHAEREERSDHGFGPGLRLRLIQATSSQTDSNVAGAAPRRVDDACLRGPIRPSQWWTKRALSTLRA